MQPAGVSKSLTRSGPRNQQYQLLQLGHRGTERQVALHRHPVETIVIPVHTHFGVS